MLHEERDLVKRYYEVIEDESNTENDIQNFLEENTELIPLPFLLNNPL